MTDAAAIRKDNGLYRGNAGMALCAYHLAEATASDPLFERADELILHMTSNLHHVQTDAFGDGQLGIGWTLHYLHANGFINTAPAAFNFFDQLFFDYNRFTTEPGVAKGTLGYLHYLENRFDTNMFAYRDMPADCNEIEKNEMMVQLLDQLDVNLKTYYANLEIFRPSDMVNFLSIPLQYLSDYLTPLCAAAQLLGKVQRRNIYPEILQQCRKRILEILDTSAALLLEYAAGSKPMPATEVYYLRKSIFQLSNAMEDFTVCKTLEISPDFLSAVKEYPVDVTFSALLSRAFHGTGNPLFADAVIAMTDKVTGYGSDHGLEHGLAGLTMSLLSLDNPEILSWDAAIGLS